MERHAIAALVNPGVPCNTNSGLQQIAATTQGQKREKQKCFDVTGWTDSQTDSQTSILGSRAVYLTYVSHQDLFPYIKVRPNVLKLLFPYIKVRPNVLKL